MKKRKQITSIILPLIVIILISCEEGSDPLTGTISGTITFTSALEEAEIIVALFKAWPPTDPTIPPMSDYYYITNDDLNSSFEYQYTFEDVSFDTYDLIGVSFTDEMNTDITTNKIFLGAHGGTFPMYYDAEPIVVSTAYYDVTHDFSADVTFAFNCVSFYAEELCEPVEGCTWFTSGSSCIPEQR